MSNRICNKCIHNKVCEHWHDAIFGSDVIHEKTIECEHYKEEIHGEWLTRAATHWVNGSFGIGSYMYECSLCGRQELQKEPYCNCGAKMDGGNQNG